MFSIAEALLEENVLNVEHLHIEMVGILSFPKPLWNGKFYASPETVKFSYASCRTRIWNMILWFLQFLKLDAFVFLACKSV